MRLNRTMMLGGLLLAGCFDVGGPEPAARRICERMVECGGWGWEDAPTCTEGLFEDGEYEEACLADDAYKRCMKDCVELACPQFQECEADCWERSC